MECACNSQKAQHNDNRTPSESEEPFSLLRWLQAPDNQLLAATGLSGVFLFFSFMGWRLGMPFDLAWFAVLLNGWPIIKESATCLATRFDVRAGLLVSIAIIAACAIGEVFAAGEVAFIMTIGELLEARTVRNARRDLEKLVSMTPRIARVLRDNVEEVIDAQAVKLADRIRVLPGETVPVDGKILAGNSSLDESAITGESLPVEKGPGDAVASGAINRFGAFEMEAVRVGSDSSLQRMISLVKDAENNKAKAERTADRWASYLVPAALLTALIVWGVTGEIIRGVTILVVFCPCALMLSTPTAIVAAMGNATRHGVIIRSGDALERLATVRELAFDKTGTITHGKPEVMAVESLHSGLSNDELFRFAVSAETLSEHPLARALVRHAQANKVSVGEISDFKMRPGFGVSANVDGRHILAGNALLLQQEGVVISPAGLSRGDEKSAGGHSLIWVAVDKEAAGFIALADTLRQDASGVLAKVRALGIGITLLTGDKRGTADSIAAQVGIDRVEAELRPEDKVAAIERMQSQGRRVCMVGDGVNDAPALKTAYVGVAMGGIGSDIAVEAADVALLRDDLSRLPYLLKLSRRTLRTIIVNIVLSMGINFVAVIFAAMGWLGPVMGALVHNGGSILVVLNASRLLSIRDDKK